MRRMSLLCVGTLCLHLPLCAGMQQRDCNGEDPATHEKASQGTFASLVGSVYEWYARPRTDFSLDELRHMIVLGNAEKTKSRINPYNVNSYDDATDLSLSHWAAMSGSQEILKQCLKSGALPTHGKVHLISQQSTVKGYMSPMHILASSRPHLIPLMAQYFDVNERAEVAYDGKETVSNVTPLHIATFFDNEEAVDNLKTYGADTQAQDGLKQKPSDIVAVYDTQSARKALESQSS